MKKLRNGKGITLIALVITIIVLLILAGVTVSIVLEDNGIVSKAILAKSEVDKSKEEEEQTLENLLNYINKNIPTDEENSSDDIIVGNPSLEETTVSMANTTAWTGSGTESDPYEIDSLEQLAHLAKQVNSGNKYTGIYFILIGDIDAEGANWIPIGNNKDRYFDGIFQGQNYTISNLETTSPYNYRGLFGFTGSNSKITDLTLNHPTCGNTNVAVNGDFTGAIVGYNRGTVINCSVNETIITGNICVGGVVGYNEGTVNNCNVNGWEITGNEYVGGIVGYNKGTVSMCIVDSVAITGTDKVDGIIGVNEGTVTDTEIQNSTVNGE